MKRLTGIAITGTSTLTLALLVFSNTAVATQTNLQLQIMPLACVVDTTATGSNVTSIIAPLECEREIFSSPGGSVAEALERTILDSPTIPHSSILSLSHTQPVAGDGAIANITASTNVNTSRTQQNIATTIGVLAAGAIIAADGALFGFASTRAAASATSAGVQKLKRALGK
jgi:hypothetical protein